MSKKYSLLIFLFIIVLSSCSNKMFRRKKCDCPTFSKSDTNLKYQVTKEKSLKFKV